MTEDLAQGLEAAGMRKAMESIAKETSHSDSLEMVPGYARHVLACLSPSKAEEQAKALLKMWALIKPDKGVVTQDWIDAVNACKKVGL